MSSCKLLVVALFAAFLISLGSSLNLSARLCWQRGGRCRRNNQCYYNEVEIGTCYHSRLKCCRDKS